MSDFYYTSKFETESNERGDIRSVEGDDQLAQQMAAIAGNTMKELFDGGVVSEDQIEEFAGSTATHLRTVDEIGAVEFVDASYDYDSETLTIDIQSSLASTTETFDI